MNNEEFPFTTPAESEASMFIQWKGTDVCMDFHCQCGAHVHGDGYFAYNVECGACGAFYQLGTQVIAKKIDEPDGACLYLVDDRPDNTPPETVTLPGGQKATVIATVAEGKVLWTEEKPKFATGGVVGGGPSPLIGDSGGMDCLLPNVIDEEYLFTKDRPFPEAARVYLNRWVTTGQALNAEEAREAEDAGLRVVEATSIEDDEPVFWPVEETGRPDQD